MEEIIILDDICRLCLGSKGKDGSLLLFKITADKSQKFEEITQTEVSLNLLVKMFFRLFKVSCSFS